MSKTVEEARRELFEAAYLKQFGRYPDKWCHVISKYLNAHANGAWWAWQAALDAVESQLPEPHSTNGGDCVIDYDETLAAI
jgi:hypothetical protein